MKGYSLIDIMMDIVATILDLDDDENIYAANRKMHEVGAMESLISKKRKFTVENRCKYGSIYCPEAATD